MRHPGIPAVLIRESYCRCLRQSIVLFRGEFDTSFVLFPNQSHPRILILDNKKAAASSQAAAAPCQKVPGERELSEILSQPR